MADLHPVTRLGLLAVWVGAVELASAVALGGLGAGALVLLVHPQVRHRFAGLMRRTRWLLIALMAAYALATPGTPMLPESAWLTPTEEGVYAGLERAGRMLLLLAGVALLFATTAPARIVYALFWLAAPLARLGFDRRAFAVRLGLVLQGLDAGRDPRPLATQLAELRGGASSGVDPERLTLEQESWGRPDRLVLLAGGLLGLAAVFGGLKGLG